jgi:hypothetical protein
MSPCEGRGVRVMRARVTVSFRLQQEGQRVLHSGKRIGHFSASVGTSTKIIFHTFSSIKDIIANLEY